MLWEWANSGAQVFILDLDGTLRPSAEIDNACFWQAVFACFGERERLPDLHQFKHVTDSSILDEWCILELGRSPRAEETRRIKHHFVQLLESAFALHPGHFTPLPGVREWLETVIAHEHVYAGIATGGWQTSARLKLKLSGLDNFGLPMASSDDAITRTQIMQIAAQRTLGRQSSDLADFTYVGDGAWDLQASRELDWRFIGIASDARAAQLKLAGATMVRPNFSR
ncbi:MAG: haloacid dehalogenase-like hydrolase [Xanthomonadales bacterium]|nr:haloacid dehalogenase-like hydrolase [Xanthomonadales bacterium]